MPKRVPTFRPNLGRPSRSSSKAERDRFYSSAPWMRLRAAFLIKHPLCHDCEARDELTPATIAHHVLERLDRPDLALDEDNLLPLCSPCHTRRHKAGNRGD